MTDTHIFIFMHIYRDCPVALYFVKSNNQVSHRGLERGIDQTQALCRAVKGALKSIHINNTYHIIIWHCPKTLSEKILTLKPHRDHHITYDTRSLMSDYLLSRDTLTITFHPFHRAWPGAPTLEDIQGLSMDLDCYRRLTATPSRDLNPQV
jgi:hypothetical protein